MANPNFNPNYTTNEIYRDTDLSVCLTDELDRIDEELGDLATGKANIDHSHTEFAEENHTHTQYADVSHTHKTDLPLWSGSCTLVATDTVTPSKPLSNCQSGWLLLWSDGNANGVGNDYDYCTSMIPKKNATGGNWNTKAFFCVLPRFSDVDLDGINIKTIKVSDTTIFGDVKNDQGGREDIILRAVYEY